MLCPSRLLRVAPSRPMRVASGLPAWALLDPDQHHLSAPTTFQLFLHTHPEGYPGSGPGLGSGALNSPGGAEWWKGGSSMVPVSYSRRGLGWNHRLVLARPSCSPLVAWAARTGGRGAPLSRGFSPLLCRTRKMGSQAASSSEKGRRKARSTGKACTQLSSRAWRLPHRPGGVRSLSCCCLSCCYPVAPLFSQDGLTIGTFSAPLPSLAL